MHQNEPHKKKQKNEITAECIASVHVQLSSLSTGSGWRGVNAVGRTEKELTEIEVAGEGGNTRLEAIDCKDVTT